MWCRVPKMTFQYISMKKTFLFVLEAMLFFVCDSLTSRSVIASEKSQLLFSMKILYSAISNQQGFSWVKYVNKTQGHVFIGCCPFPLSVFLIKKRKSEEQVSCPPHYKYSHLILFAPWTFYPAPLKEARTKPNQTNGPKNNVTCFLNSQTSEQI